MPNDFTGRKVNKNSPLPSEAVVAMTLLGGQRACMICGEPVMDGRVVCEEDVKSLEPFSYSSKEGREFLGYRDAPFRPKWFRDTRFGTTQTQEQYVQDQYDEHTEHCKSGGNTACVICQTSRLHRAKAVSESWKGYRRKASKGQPVASRRAVGLGTRKVRCSGLGALSSLTPLGIETPSAAYGEGPHRKAAKIRQLALLYRKNPLPLTPDQDLIDHFHWSYGYGGQVRRSGP